MSGVASDRDVRSDVGSGGVNDRHALKHPVRSDAPAQHREGVREVDAGVDPHRLGGIIEDEVRDSVPSLGGYFDHIREVDLALFCAWRYLGQMGPEEVGVVDVDAGVEFADQELLRRGLGLLDDA